MSIVAFRSFLGLIPIEMPGCSTTYTGVGAHSLSNYLGGDFVSDGTGSDCLVQTANRPRGDSK